MEDMETSICLDTGIVVDILRREEKAITWLKQVKRDRPIAITLITVFEIYRGIYISKNSLQESEAFEYLKKQLLVLPLVEKHVREAARISIILQKEGIPRYERCLLPKHHHRRQCDDVQRDL